LTDATTSIVEQTLRIAARPETVWRYWTDPERIRDWWGTAADLDPTPGGAYRVEMDNGGVMRGAFVELVPHERIVFSFGWEPMAGAPALPPGSTTVEVTLVPDGPDTVMTLRHRDIPAAVADQHDAGWAHFLRLLAEAASAEGSA
jgi:uncharacterized protein YndB with AHSA1/START domain